MSDDSGLLMILIDYTTEYTTADGTGQTDYLEPHTTIPLLSRDQKDARLLVINFKT